MTSNTNKRPQLLNGNEDDPYKSEGHIEMRIENLTGFVQEKDYTERRSEPVYVRGMPWKIFVTQCSESDQQKDGQKYIGCDLEYEDHRYDYDDQLNDDDNKDIDTSCNYTATAKLKILAQKEECIDYVYEARDTSINSRDSLWLSLGGMALEELMNSDKGWYDAQSDSIVLAMDLTVNPIDKGVGDSIMIAQNEFTLDRVPTSISMQIGYLEWQINYDFNDQNNKNRGTSVVLSCKDVANGRVDKGMLELFGYQLFDDSSKHEMIYSRGETLHLFTRKDNSLRVYVPSECKKVLLAARAWKERIHFPDFTKPTAMVGRFSAGVKLRVGDQQFHVNRQLLSTHSLFFDRMFHGDYTAATQQEVELSLITHSPELFHHFLLVMCVSEALPNSMNVSALFKLADFYDAENVNKKCDQHLRAAREMPIEKRVLLARDHCTKETQALIVDSVNLEQSKRIINNLFMQNR